MSLLAAAGAITNPAAGFDVENDITWHSLFWAEGTAMTAQGYSDTDAVTTWPNETGESDATSTTGKEPLFATARTEMNSKPALVFDGANDFLQTAAFSVNPSYASGVSFIAIAEGHDSNDGLFDGRHSAARNTVWYSLSSPYELAMFAGGSIIKSATMNADSGLHGWRALFDGGTGNDTVHVDGTKHLDADAGSHTIDGLTIGNNYVPTTVTAISGSIAFVGVYEGDITADGNWAAMQSWVSDHYGVTI